MHNGGASDTDFQAQGAESDENDTEGYESGFNAREEIVGEVQKNGQLSKSPAAAVPLHREPPTLTQPTVKGKKPVIPTSMMSEFPTNTYLPAARPFKRVKVPSGPAPHFNGDGPSDYTPIGGLPPNHLCSACDEMHPMGWCRLKVAGVEHCGLCGLAHVGHGRTCPHLNSEAQVATLLGTLKESTESRELIEQATKYLRMIRGDLVQRKRKQENMQTPNAPAYAKMVGPPVGNLDENNDLTRSLESYHPQIRPQPISYRYGPSVPGYANLTGSGIANDSGPPVGTFDVDRDAARLLQSCNRTAQQPPPS